MNNRTSEDDLKRGSEQTRSAAINGAKALKKLKNTNKSASNAFKLFSNKLNFYMFIGVLGFIVLLMFVSLISFSPSSLMAKEETDYQKTTFTLEEVINEKKKESLDLILETLSEKYKGYDFSKANINFADGEYTITASSDKNTICLIVKYTPEIKDFSKEIENYAKSVNGVILLFEGDSKSKEAYGQESNNNEYLNSDSQDFYDSLQLQAKEMITYQKDPKAWIWDTTGTDETVIIKKYFKKFIENGQFEDFEVSPIDNYENIKVIKKKNENISGTITIEMSCDKNLYKADTISKIKNDIVGEAVYIKVDGVTQSVVLTNELANQYIDELIKNYVSSFNSPHKKSPSSISWR